MKRRNKIFLTAILSVIMLLTGTLFLLVEKKDDSVNNVNALLNSKEFTGLDDIKVGAYRAKRGNINLTTYPVNNGDFVMLYNAGKQESDSTRDVVLFSIEAINGKKLTILDVNVTLNGNEIVYNGYSDSDPEDATATTNKSLKMRLTGNEKDLTYQTESLGDVPSAEGYYEFFFRVSLDGGTIYPLETGYFYHYGFYLLNESSYCEEDQIPTPLNVDPDLAVNTSIFYKNQYIYNFNKFSEGKNLYPTIRFDPEKYDLVLSRTYRNTVETISTVFEYTDNQYNKVNYASNYGVLTFNYSLTNKQVSFKMQRNSGYFIFNESFNYADPNATNYFEPLFKNLGAYEIQKQYKLYIGSQFITENKPEGGNIAIQSDMLTVFGYVAHYAEAGTGSAEFNSYTTAEFSDVTRLAEERAGEKVFTEASFSSLINYNVVSTNQAPVWFEYNGVLVAGEYWYADAEYSSWNKPTIGLTNNSYLLDDSKVYTYTKSDYFEKSGYYLVKLKYRMESDIGNDVTYFTQYIAFQLRNVSPVASSQASLEGTFTGSDLFSIDSAAFTKGSVRFAIEEKSTFDSKITLYVTHSPLFDGKGTRTTFTPYYMGENNTDYTVFSEAGLYNIEVHFGTGSYSVYTFSIDKQELTDVISITGVSAYFNSSNKVEFKIDESKDFTNRNYINEAFTIFADEKLSGAQITASVRTILVDPYVDETGEDKKLETPVSGSETYWSFIDYRAQNISSTEEYSFVRKGGNLRILNEDNIFTSQKIYIFEFSDKAGYTASYVMFLDKTTSHIIQKKPGGGNDKPDSFNVVSETTELYWGSHKVIKFDASGYDGGYREKLAQLAPDVFVEYDNALNIVIPINSVTIKQEELALGGKVTTQTVTSFNDYTKMLTVYPTEEDVPDKDTDGAPKNKYSYGEGIYTIKVLDDAGNELSYRLEMNLDKSQVKAMVSSSLKSDNVSVDNPEYHVSNQIRINQATSRYGLFISFINSDNGGDDTFAIESLTYDYYPYDLSIENESLPSYPYSANPTIENVNILSNVGEYGTGENQYITGVIKAESYNDGGTNVFATAPGKYVITRVYKGDAAVVSSAKDSKEKQYTFFVDRNPIIDIPDFTDSTVPYIGDGIFFEFGSQRIEFNEFYRGIYTEKVKVANYFDFDSGDSGEIYKDISLVTNLIPLRMYVPSNKYGVSGPNALMTFNLTVRVTHYNDYELVSDNYYVGSSGYIEIPEFKLPGFYVVEMFDMAVEPNNQITPNANSLGYFALEIKLDKPEGYFQTSQDGKVDPNVGVDTTENIDFSIDENGEFKVVFPNTYTIGNPFIYEVYRAEQSGSGDFSAFTLYTEAEIFEKDQEYKYITLPAFGYSDGELKTYKYKFAYISNDNVAIERYSPVMEDFGSFTQLTKTSTKDNILEFTFTDPVDKYYAKIDVSKIRVERYLKSDSGAFVKDTGFKLEGAAVQNLVEVRLVSDNRRFYSLTLDASVGENGFGNEYVYFIHLSYYGDASDYENPVDFESYHSNKQSLLIDRTPPSYFLNKLIAENQSYLTAYGITEPSSLYNYATGDGVTSNYVYYYARVGNFDFKISADFQFSRPKATEFVNQDQETQYMYIRPYLKYQVEAEGVELSETYQAVVPGDPSYYDVSSLNIRFNNTDSKWKRFEYNGQTFANIYKEFTDTFESIDATNKITDEYYFEIVEVDEAGNHTVYTVKYVPNETFINVGYTHQGSVNKYGDLRSENNSIVKEFTAINKFEILYINSVNYSLIDAWYTITIGSEKFYITPETDLDMLIQEMNQVFTLGRAYRFEISNRFGQSFKYNIIVASQDTYLDLPTYVDPFPPAEGEEQDPDKKFYVYIPNDSEIVKLQTMIVRRYDAAADSRWADVYIAEYVNTDNTYYEVETLFDFNTMSSEFFTGTRRLIYLTSGVYQFEFTDNVRDASYTVSIKIGVNDVFEWGFGENTYNDPNNNNIKTTDSNATLRYNSSIYEVSVLMDDKTYEHEPAMEDDIYTITFAAPKNVSDINVRSGGKYSYLVTVRDRITNEYSEYKFVVYNIFPAVQVTDETGNSKIGIIAVKYSDSQNIELTSFTSTSVYFVWETMMDYGYSVTLHRYKDSTYNELLSSTVITMDRVTASAEGVYALEFKNTFLQSTKSLCFIIKDSTISMYAVYENVPGVGYKMLSPSSVMIDLDTCKHVDEAAQVTWDDLIANYTKITKQYPRTVVDGVGKFMVKSYFTNYSINIEVEGDKLIKTNYTDINNGEAQVRTNFRIKNEINSDFESYVVVVYGTTPYSYLDVFVVTRVAASNSIIGEMGYEYEVKSEVEGEPNRVDEFHVDFASQDYIQINVSPCVLTWSAFYGMAQNTIAVTYYFNNRLIETTLGEDYGTTRELTLSTPGEYRFVFSDLAGNTQRFGTSGSRELTILLLSEVVYKVNGGDPIYGAVYNDKVTLSVEDATRYKDLTVTCYKNGEEFAAPNEKNVYTFTEAGVYRVVLKAAVVYGKFRTDLKDAVLMFTIINKNEAKFAYEFTDLNGYEIVKVTKGGFLDTIDSYIDITDIIKSTNNVVTIYNLVLSEDKFGTGKYQIFVEGTSDNILMDGQGFAFEVWINNEIPVITSSIEPGTETLDVISITYNAQSIYEQIGESSLVIYRKVGSTLLGKVEYNVAITSEFGNGEATVLNVELDGEYYVTLVTNTGNVVSMFKVTKNEPLNTVAIIIIVISVIVVIVGIIIFVKFRLKMAVK